jgi:phage terminase large subunit-like protein
VGGAAFVEAGNVFMPDPAEWPEVKDWLDEVCGFPKAGHDDRVARSRRRSVG